MQPDLPQKDDEVAEATRVEQADPSLGHPLSRRTWGSDTHNASVMADSLGNAPSLADFGGLPAPCALPMVHPVGVEPIDLASLPGFLHGCMGWCAKGDSNPHGLATTAV